MAVVEIAKIQVRRGQENQTGVPQLDPGELGWAEDTQNLYIGKRISEGANSDDNARILTDKDLSGIFSQVVGAINAASTSTYRYGAIDNLQYSVLHSTTSVSYATKLDNWVSLTDFSPNGVWPPLAGNDITDILNTVMGPYGVVNNTHASIGPYAIKIPAGHYTVSGTTNLPPNTKLVGEGAGLTVITEVSGLPIFQTVDSNGHTFFDMNGTQDGSQPKNIHIEGMTLIGTANASLILLDNVASADILNVNFGEPTAATSTSVTGVVLRSFAVTSDASLALSSNIRINDCTFNGLDKGVYQNTGTTNRYYIQNSEFSNMNHSVEMWSGVNGLGPVNGVIESNIFENIANEAIYIGTATNTATNSYVVSSKNTFRNVGNNFNGDAGTQVTPVITFNNGGNSSNNDFFGRLSNPVNTVTNYSVIAGPATIDSAINYSATVGSDISVTAGYTVTNIVLSGRDQLIKIDYTMIDKNNTVFTRTGQLTLNITPANIVTGSPVGASVSDYFNYSELLEGSSNFVIFSTDVSNVDKDYVSLTCINQLAYSTSTTGLSMSTSTNFNIEYKLNILQ